MASFQAKTGRDMLRMIPKKKKLSFLSIPTWLRIRNSKTIEKKCKKLRNIIMASFQAKMVLDILGMTRTIWDKTRMIQKKFYGSDPFQPDPE